MARCKILLADRERSYLEALLLLLLQEYGASCDIQVATSSEYLDRLFSTPQNIDMLIIGENLWKAEYGRQDFRNLYILCEERSAAGRAAQKGTAIYRYSSDKEIFQTISLALRRIAGEEKAYCKVIMTYSPQGGSGRTTCAMGLAAALNSLGSRVLYCNTESIQSFGEYLGLSRYMGADLIGELRQGRPQFKTVQANTEKKLFSFLLPTQYSLAGNGLSTQQYLALIETVKNSRQYDFIIVDTSSDLTQEKVEMMKRADHVLIPVLQNRNGVMALKALARNLNVADNDKFMFLCSAYDRDEPDELKEAGLHRHINEYIEKKAVDLLEAISRNQDNPYIRLAYQLI